MGAKKASKRTRRRARKEAHEKVVYDERRPPGWVLALWASDLRLGLLIFSLGAIARAVYFVHLTHNSPLANILIHDSALFNHFAHQILAGKLVLDRAYYLSPLYSYFLAVVYWLLGDSFNVVRAVQFVLGAFGAVIVFLLGKEMISRRAGAIAGLFAALYAPFLFFEGSLLGTSLATFLFLLSVYGAVVAARRGSALLWTASGLLFGLATTGRPNLLTVIPALVAAPWLLQTVKSRRALAAGLWFVAFLLPIAGTMLHNRVAEGQWIPLTTHGGINFYIGNHRGASGVWEAPEGMEASVSAINLEEASRAAEAETGRRLTAWEVSNFWYRKAFQFILKRPHEWLALVLKKFVLFWNPYEVPLNFEYGFHERFSWLLRIPLTNFAFLVPFALFGLVLAWPERRRLGFLYATTGLYVAGVVLFFISGRYRLLVVPLLMLFGAYCVEWLLERRSPEPRKVRAVGAALLAAVALSLLAGLTQASRANPANEYYNLCVAHLNEGHIDEAIYWGRKAVLADPSIKNAHYNLGVALMKKGYYREALDAFQRVVELDPGEAAAWGNMGGIYLRLGEVDEAITNLQRAIEADSNYVLAWLNLGIAYYRNRDLEEARRAWENALRVDPENRAARRNLEALRAYLEGR